MRILDTHIHILSGDDTPAELAERLRRAGIAGGMIISRAPMAFGMFAGTAAPPACLSELLAWTAATPDCFSCFWIDPLDEDALAQVEMAVARGVDAFKVICHAYYPGDPRVLPVFAAIARAGKPILFHSGILWDGRPSSRYNQPVNFEALLDVPGLTFALAHISWPWCEEALAVYGKFLNARVMRPELGVEMFIDLTPGTPPRFRADALTRLLTAGYDIERNLLFGTDGDAGDFHADYAQQWIERDLDIYRALDTPQTVIEDIFANNLLRFLGKSVTRDR